MPFPYCGRLRFRLRFGIRIRMGYVFIAIRSPKAILIPCGRDSAIFFFQESLVR